MGQLKREIEAASRAARSATRDLSRLASERRRLRQVRSPSVDGAAERAARRQAALRLREMGL